MQQKKWAFTELVKNPDNTEELIAYAMYKADKDALANSQKAMKVPELQMQSALQAFHDSVATTPRLLQNYRDRAITMIRTLTDTLSSNVEGKCQAQQKNDH